jgi:hypothetical protein
MNAKIVSLALLVIFLFSPVVSAAAQQPVQKEDFSAQLFTPATPEALYSAAGGDPQNASSFSDFCCWLNYLFECCNWVEHLITWGPEG